MSGREFLDTNVLIYAHDAPDPRKRARARELIRRLVRKRRGVLSPHVLQEFFAAATRKLWMSSEDARSRIVLYSRFDIVTFGAADLTAAIDLHRLHHPVDLGRARRAGALNAACPTLHTADMQSGHVVKSLTPRNHVPVSVLTRAPFAQAPTDSAARVTKTSRIAPSAVASRSHAPAPSRPAFRRDRP